MLKKLSTISITLADKLDITKYICWDNGVTNQETLDRCISLGVEIPTDILNDFKSAPTYLEPPSLNEIESIESSLLNPKYDSKSGHLYYYDKDLKLYLTCQMFEGGFGLSGSSIAVNSFMRRNDASLTTTAAMPYPYPIVVFQLFCSADTSAAGAFFDCIHSSMDGTNSVIAGRLLMNQQNSQIGYSTTNLKVLIPAFRRVTMKTGGATMSQLQGVYKYREVLDIPVS